MPGLLEKTLTTPRLSGYNHGYGGMMGLRNDEWIVSAVVSVDTRERLVAGAQWRGMTLSKYMGAILSAAAIEDGEGALYDLRKSRQHHGSTVLTLPPEMVEHLRLQPGAPVAFAPIPSGVLIWAPR